MDQQKKTRQEREVRFADIRLRDEQGATNEQEGYYVLEGTPIVFNTPTRIGKDWGNNDVFEVMEPECFDSADISDVVFNVNHGDGNHAVARTRNGTLDLHKTATGVDCTIRLDKSNPRCAQAYTDVKSGLLDRMSFAFTVDEEAFNSKENCYHVRKLGKIYDVSAVDHPAYETTSISARRRENAVAEREAAVAARKLEQERSLTVELLHQALTR